MFRKPCIFPLSLILLTACTGGPARVAGPQETAVYGGTTPAAAGQILQLRRADGSPLDGATVDLGGKLVEVKNGRLVVPAEIWQRASAAGGLLIAVPGYVPVRAGTGADANLPLSLIAYASSSELAPLTSPIQTGDKGLTLSFPGQAAGAAGRAGVGLYHVPVDPASHQATLDRLAVTFAQVKAGHPPTTSALVLPGAASSGAKAGTSTCPLAALCEPVTTSLGVALVVEGGTVPQSANVALDLDKMLRGWDGGVPEPWTVAPANWTAAQIEEARSAQRILATFVAIDASPDAAAWRETLEKGYGITLDGHILRLDVGLSGGSSTVSSVTSDVLGVRLDVSLVAVPKEATVAGLAPTVVLAGQTTVIAEKPLPTSTDVTLGGFPLGQPVFTLPGGEAVRPDNGPASLVDFNSGTGSVLTKVATGDLAKTVVDLRTGTTLQTPPGESVVDVVERANGGSIISNNGVSIVANHGGGVISDNGGGVKPVDDGNHDLKGGAVVSYPYAPFAPPQAKFELLQVGVPTPPQVRVSTAGLREWLWPGMMRARAIAITGEALTDWTTTDDNGRIALGLPPAMPLLFFMETQPAPNLATVPFHEYSLVFAPRGRVSLAAVDSSTSYNAIPFIFLTTYADEQTASNNNTLDGLKAQLSSLQAQVAADPTLQPSLQPQIDLLSSRIAAIEALLAFLAQLEKDLDAGKNQLDVTSVFRFLKNPVATSILAAPALKDSYDGLKTECFAESFKPLSYPLVNLP